MEPIKMMQDKFLMLAEKLGLDTNTLNIIKGKFDEKIKNIESQADVADDKKEGEKNPEGTKADENEDKTEGENDATEGNSAVQIDIAKPIENRLPTEEDLSKMSQEELLAFSKKMINKENDTPKQEAQPTPFAVMVKRQGY